MIPLLNNFPVNNLPDLLQKLLPQILIVYIIGMFPDINSQQGGQLHLLQSLLVLSGLDLQLLSLIISTEPNPSTSLNLDSFLDHNFLKIFNCSKNFLNLFRQLRVLRGQDPSLLLNRRQILPINTMIDMTPEIEGNLFLDFALFLQILVFDLGLKVFLKFGKIGQVSIMVFEVVEFHGLLR